MNRFLALLLVSVAACQFQTADAATQHNQDLVRCGNKGPYQLQTDGLCLDAEKKAPGLIVNGSFDKMFQSSLYNAVEADFLGFFLIADSGDTYVNSNGPWTSEDTATAGCPARKGDADDGALELLLDNGNEVGDCDLYWGDEQNIDSDTEPFCIFRLQYQVAPAAADSLVWGLASAQNDLYASLTTHALFSVAGADNNLDTQSDDNSTDVNATDTGVDLVAGTYTEFMVSLNSMHGVTTSDTNGASATDVHYFYRSTLGGDWTQVNAGTTFSIGADVALQPLVHVEKTSGTSVPDLLVDYVRCYWERS